MSVTPYLDWFVNQFPFDPTLMEQAAAVVQARILAILFQVLDLLPSARPLIQALGPPGSTKTTFARGLGAIATGTGEFIVPTNMPSNERGFWISISKFRWAIFDNIENPPKWFPDSLAVATSGGQHGERMLYTNSDLITFGAAGLLCITSFTGSIARGDLLDRSIFFRLRVPSQRKRESMLLKLLQEYAPAIKAELDYVAGQLRARGLGGLDSYALPDAGRLADFTVVGRLLAEATGGAGDLALFNCALQAQKVERVRVATGNPLVGAVVVWASSSQNLAPDSTRGLWVTATHLVRYFAASMGNAVGFQLTERDASRLGKLLQELKQHSAGILNIEDRIRNGRTEYRVRLTDETLAVHLG